MDDDWCYDLKDAPEGEDVLVSDGSEEFVAWRGKMGWHVTDMPDGDLCVLHQPPVCWKLQHPLKGLSMTTASSVRFRRRMPPIVRNAYRLGRYLVNGRRQTSPKMLPELISDCRMCASRHDLLRHLPEGGHVAEVGTDTGAFARSILSRSLPAELHLIDIETSRISEDVRAAPAVRVHEGLSNNLIASFEDGYFDWIYIDADHSYDGVLRDAEAARLKVRPGGYLVFNDFAHSDLELGQYGVQRAVVEFSVTHRWPFAWWAYQVAGLYDVALQRPISQQ